VLRILRKNCLQCGNQELVCWHRKWGRDCDLSRTLACCVLCSHVLGRQDRRVHSQASPHSRVGSPILGWPRAAFALAAGVSRHDMGCPEVSGGPARLLRACRHDMGCLEVSGGPARLLRASRHDMGCLGGLEALRDLACRQLFV
jgi:hypothetical protein